MFGATKSFLKEAKGSPVGTWVALRGVSGSARAASGGARGGKPPHIRDQKYMYAIYRMRQILSEIGSDTPDGRWRGDRRISLETILFHLEI